MKDYASYIRQRISELRMDAGISESKLSMDLGQNKNYIQDITSGKALPSMTQLLKICEYFAITPMTFFHEENTNPRLIQKALNNLYELDDGDLALFVEVIERFNKKQKTK